MEEKALKKMEPAPQITFEIDPRKHPLQKTLKKLDKNVDAAIEVVLKVLGDDSLDPKTRLIAAQYLLDTKIKLNESISKEVLTRQISQVRMLQASQPKRAVDVEDDDDSPQVIFSPNVIQRIDATNI